jgi:hypothetical protein
MTMAGCDDYESSNGRMNFLSVLANTYGESCNIGVVGVRSLPLGFGPEDFEHLCVLT